MRRERRRTRPRYLRTTFSSLLVLSTDMYRSAQLMQRPPIHVMAFSSRRYLLIASGRSNSYRLQSSKHKDIITPPCHVSLSSTSNNIEHNSDNHQSEGRVCVMMPLKDNNDTFRNEAQNFANHLALPLFIQFPSIDDDTEWNASYTHCLSLEPYHFLDIETYALAIQPFSGTFDD